MMKRKAKGTDTEAGEPKRLRFDMGAVVSMIKKMMSSSNAVPFLRKGRFEECDDKMYLEDVLTRVEDGSHGDIDDVFNDIYKVFKTERDGNEIQLEDREKQVYDEADALIMAGMMMKTAKSLQKEMEDVLRVDDEEKDGGDLVLESSSNVLKQLKRQFGSIPDNALHDEAVKMMLADDEGRKKITEDLSRMNRIYQPKFEVVKIDEAEDGYLYMQISNYFKKTLCSRKEGENCEIENIFKIENIVISDIYNDASKEMERTLKEKSKEELLFHGTSEKAIAAIIKNNFDADASPTDLDIHGEQRQKRSQYGKGIYFSSSSAVALMYGNNILVCKVILGNVETISLNESRSFTREIPEEYDSRKVTGKNGKDICVIKETHHILPYCVITLKNKHLSSQRKKEAFVSCEKQLLSTRIGKIREILTSDDKAIQMNKLTTVYLDYIKMIEVKEEASKDAPTEVVKNNVTKIYKEVTSGGMFYSLTNGIRGIFSSARAVSSSNGAQASNAGQGSSSMPMPPIKYYNASSGRTFTLSLEVMKQSVPDTYREAKILLSGLKDCCELLLNHSICNFDRSLVYNAVKLLSGIGSRFKLEIEKDPYARKNKFWLRDHIHALYKLGR